MEVEPPLTYTFRLADGSLVTLSNSVIQYLGTIRTMLGDLPLTQKNEVIPLVNEQVTKAILDWIVDAYAIYNFENGEITSFEELYANTDRLNRLLQTRNPEASPLLTLFGQDGRMPDGKQDFPLLFDLIRSLNYLDGGAMLVVALDRIDRILQRWRTEEIRALITRTELREVTVGLPLTPYYRRERYIRAFLAEHLPPELIRPNRALQKYIEPIASTEYTQLFLKSDGLYSGPAPSADGLVASEIPGKPLLIACGKAHSLCLTNQGLYGRGGNALNQLGLGRSVIIVEDWTQIDVDGEVLLLSAGRHHTLVLTTTGLYVCGSNTEGQLGSLFGAINPYLARLDVVGYVRHIHAGDRNTFVLTTTGLYACGANYNGELAVGSLDENVYKLTPVENLKGNMLSIAADEGNTSFLTSSGLYAVGQGPFGELGLGPVKSTTTLQEVTPLDGKPLSVHAGSGYSVLHTSRGLYATGINRAGQLAVGDLERRNTYTETEGLEGDLWGICCAENTIFVLTTRGLYLSGLQLGYPREGERVARVGDKYVTFQKLAIDMGYFPARTLLREDENERPQKRPRLDCAYCHCKARFIASQRENAPVCSKICLYRLIK